MKGISNVCLLMERCDGYGGCKGMWEGVKTSSCISFCKHLPENPRIHADSRTSKNI